MTKHNKDFLTDTILPPVHGMVTFLNVEDVPSQFCTLAKNIVFEDGTAAKRFGYTKLNAIELASAAKVRSLWYGQGGGSITNKLMAISAGKIYSIDTGTGVATERATGLSTTQNWDFTEGVLSGTPRIVMVAPGNLPYQWDGVAASASTFTGPATNCNYAAYHLSALWLADADLRTIYKSKLDVMNIWNTIDYIIIGKEEDGPITRIVSMGRYMVVFMQKAIYILAGNRIQYPRNVSVERVGFEDGCPAPWSVVRIKDQIFFLSHDGVCVLSGKTVKKISYAVDDDFQSIDRTYIDEARGGRFDNMYWVSIPHNGATTNNRTYVFHSDLPLNEFGELPISFFTGLVGNSFAYSFGRRKTYFGSLTTGFVYYYDTSLYSDDTAAFEYDLITRGYSFGDVLLEKRLSRLSAELDVVSGGSVKISTGQNEIATGSFVECPSASAATPLLLDSTGIFMSDYGGESTYARNGIVHANLAVPASGDPTTGTWFRVRLNESSTKNMVFRRGDLAAIAVAR